MVHVSLDVDTDEVSIHSDLAPYPGKSSLQICSDYPRMHALYNLRDKNLGLKIDSTHHTHDSRLANSLGEFCRQPRITDFRSHVIFHRFLLNHWHPIRIEIHSSVWSIHIEQR